MAKLDDLIGQVQDARLRSELRDAADQLRRDKKFGLVFEEHIPETTVLHRYPVRRGATVYERSDYRLRTPFQVRAVVGSEAVVQPTRGPEKKLPIEQLLVSKRFGEPIYGTLTPLGSLHRAPPDRPGHAVINGENYHALELLLYMYEGKVDCIYCDPPYNTGAKDWKYNNHYVDSADRWRHSKWLSFMEKRLMLAKRLLKPDGVLIVTIDEHEVHHLGMLLERVFPHYLRHMVTIVMNPKGTGKHNFARVDEYAIFCVPDLGRNIISGLPIGFDTGTLEVEIEEAEDEFENESGDQDEPETEVIHELQNLPFPHEDLPMWELRHARRRGNESSYRHQRPNQFYPIYIDPIERMVVRAGPSLSIDEAPDFKDVDGFKAIWPIDKEGNQRCWRFVPETMNKAIAEGRVMLGQYNKARNAWTLNIWYRRSAAKKLKTVWWEKRHDAGTHGTTLLHNLLGVRGAFPFPKSLYAVQDCLAAVVREKPDALIVDYFAGSGTTLHAVCLLNLDGGRRRAIVVTNNEVSATQENRLRRQGFYRGDPEFEAQGIFERATRPRIEAAVSGNRPDGTELVGLYSNGRPLADGFEENVDFFRLDYLDPDDVELGRQFEAILPALWLTAGGIGDWGQAKTTNDFFLLPGLPFGVLFRESKFPRFLKALEKRPDITHVWLVTDSERAYAEMRAALPEHLTTSMLYRDYLMNFRVNTR